jgi:hypothetical protein
MAKGLDVMNSKQGGTSGVLGLAAIVVGLVGLIAASPAYAIPVYGTDASGELTGSRTKADLEIITGGNYSSQNFTVSWEITPGAGTYNYKYSFTNFGAPDLSHVVLDLSAVCTGAAAGCVQNAASNGVIGALEYGMFGPHPSNPGFPAGATIQGIKFDDLDGSGAGFYIAFDSNRVPVYGDIYGKGGRDSSFYNAGLANHLSDNINYFVVVPDSQAVSQFTSPPLVHSPEPGTVLLLGGGLVGLAAWKRLRQTPTRRSPPL